MANQISQGGPDSGKGGECPPPHGLNVTEQTTHNSKEREVERGEQRAAGDLKLTFYLCQTSCLPSVLCVCVCVCECMFMCVHLCVGVV